MTTSLTDADRHSVVEMVTRFADKEIRPRVQEYDASEESPMDLVARMADLGLMGGVLPEEYGGAGLDYRTFCDVVIALATVDQNMAAFATFPTGLVGSSILKYGTEEQKQRWLTPLARGQAFGAAGVTEPRSGSDVAGTETTYRRDGGDFVINGAKAWITNVGIASFVLVFASRDRSLGRAGISAFIVPTDTPGVEFNPYKDKLGFRAFSTGEVALVDARVPEDALLGEEGEGFRVAMSAVERGRLGVALRGVGVTLGCLEACKEYANERIVFEQPISKFQIVQSKITDMVVGAETSRLLVLQLADELAAGRRARQLACMAKMYATDVAQRSANDAVQIHGAYGTSPEYAVSRHYRDAKVLQIVEGSNDLHRALVAEIELGLRSTGEASARGRPNGSVA
jgi:alkylation response protein AidB-like acyl-CoA dehydrogenase